MKHTRILALTLVTLFALMLLASCSPVGELNVAIVMPNPPLAFHGEKQIIQGYDIEVAKALAASQGKTLRTVSMPFDELLQAVADGQVDCAIAGITATPEREALVDFSIPYFVSGQVIVTKIDSPIASQEDLSGQPIALMGGSTAQSWADTNLPGTALNPVGDPGMVLAALKAGTAAAGILDAATAQYYITNETDDEGNPLFHTVGQPLFQEKIAVAVKKGNSALLDKSNAAIHALASTVDEASGNLILENLARQYLGESAASTVAEMTTAAS